MSTADLWSGSTEPIPGTKQTLDGARLNTGGTDGRCLRMVGAVTRDEPLGSAEQDHRNDGEVDHQLQRSRQLDEVHRNARDDKGRDAEQ